MGSSPREQPLMQSSVSPGFFLGGGGVLFFVGFLFGFFLLLFFGFWGVFFFVCLFVW